MSRFPVIDRICFIGLDGDLQHIIEFARNRRGIRKLNGCGLSVRRSRDGLLGQQRFVSFFTKLQHDFFSGIAETAQLGFEDHRIAHESDIIDLCVVQIKILRRGLASQPDDMQLHTFSTSRFRDRREFVRVGHAGHSIGEQNDGCRRNAAQITQHFPGGRSRSSLIAVRSQTLEFRHGSRERFGR